jgi:nitronate monooxygenase
MLAGVDYILMGAGIPRTIPGVLDLFATGESARQKLDVDGALPGEEFFTSFDPREFFGGAAPVLSRPKFLAIVASATLAMTLAKKSNGRVDGFIVEGSTAGGHNAPPRGPMQLSEKGEPLYGERDTADLEKIKALGLPFWLAGGFGRPDKLAEALSLGAAGIQVGTAFAFCDESGIEAGLKQRVISESLAGRISIFTDPLASPTGFPFKVVKLEGTITDPAVYAARKRLCDLGYLRQAYRKADGTLGYRCPAELPENYVNKGGQISETTGRICLCNGLAATANIGQVQADGYREPALLTAGDDITNLTWFVKDGHASYTAADVIHRLTACLAA